MNKLENCIHKTSVNLTDISCTEMYDNFIKRSEPLGSGTPMKWHKTSATDKYPCAKPLFVTISLPPKLRVLVLRGSRKRTEQTYGSLTHPRQLEICYRYFSTVFYPFMDPGAKAILTWELNSSGDVHLHGLIWDSWLTNDYDLWSYRKTISNQPLVMRIMRSQKIKKDWFNNIVYCDNIYDTLKYMDKDHEMKKMKHYYIWKKNFYDPDAKKEDDEDTDEEDEINILTDPIKINF